jgi:undecaprenyl-diphosphatase
MADVEAVAEWLARHALVLLGLGVALVLLAVAGVAALIRALVPLRAPLARRWSRVLAGAQQHPLAAALVTRTGGLLSGYLLLHLATGLAAVTAISVFAVFAEEIASSGAVARFDVAFARALHDSATPRWRSFFAAISWLGSGPVLTIATVALSPLVWRLGGTLAAVLWMAAQAGGGLLNWALKETFTRTRPEFADPSLAGSWSFPSGHAMTAFVFCGVGTYLIARYSRSQTALALAAAVSLAWCLAVAFSRLYLGVHFASDVIAGLFAGAAWVAVSISILEVFAGRRQNGGGHIRRPPPHAATAARDRTS